MELEDRSPLSEGGAAPAQAVSPPATDTIAQRLRLAIGEMSVNGFANRCGVAESTLRKYLLGSRPGSDRLRKIAAAAGVSADWLLTGKGSMHRPVSRKPKKEEDVVWIPIYEVYAAAGNGYINQEEGSQEKIALQASWIRQKFHTSPQGLEMIYVRGESMEPTLRSGDVVLLDKKIQEVSEGIYVLRLEDSVFVKRLHLFPGKVLEVSSDNAAYKTFEIDLKRPPEDFGIIGRVLCSFHFH